MRFFALTLSMILCACQVPPEGTGTEGSGFWGPHSPGLDPTLTEGPSGDGGDSGDDSTPPPPTTATDPRIQDYLQYCPDGVLGGRTRDSSSNGLTSRNYHTPKVPVFEGSTRQFCLPIIQPQVPASLQKLHSVYVDIYEAADTECGVVTMELEQLFPPYRKLSDRGAALFLAHARGEQVTPSPFGGGSSPVCEDCAARGVYLLTLKNSRDLTGSFGKNECGEWRLDWGWVAEP